MRTSPAQPELAFHGRPLWNDPRSRPGRRPGPNPRVRHRSREPFARARPCHVTLKVRSGLPSLRLARVVRALEDTFRRGCERGGFRLVHYSLQDDHAHLVVEASGREALACGMKSLAARFAFAVNRALGRRGRVLADRYHLRVLRTPREVRHALAYVLVNARRHLAKRLGRRGVPPPRGIDPASSGAWFDGWRREGAAAGFVLPDGARRVGPGRAREMVTAAARTWLLRVGWRRHGLIDSAEVPGGQRQRP